MPEAEILAPEHHASPIPGPLVFEKRGDAHFAFVPHRSSEQYVMLPLGSGMLISWWQAPEFGGVVVNILTDEPNPRLPFLEIGQSIALDREQLQGAIAILQSIDKQMGEQGL